MSTYNPPWAKSTKRAEVRQYVGVRPYLKLATYLSGLEPGKKYTWVTGFSSRGDVVTIVHDLGHKWRGKSLELGIQSLRDSGRYLAHGFFTVKP